MEPNKLIKDKNKLLMAIPVILGILFLYVFFIREDGNVPSGSDRQAASQAFLEPQSEMADKARWISRTSPAPRTSTSTNC